ncbi:MAG: COG4280 domain-containing protein [Methanobacterium sp.]
MNWSIFLPAFLACIVEWVEALTIVLAIGASINWKSSLWGAASGLALLAVLIAAFGSAIVLLIPINILRIVIGIILVLFGIQWLEKAILRYTGLKSKHDEAKVYETTRQEYDAMEIDHFKFNKFGFLTSFKSVFLEGLEVAVIVITFGLTGDTNPFQGIYTTSLAAIMALLVVIALGVVIRKPLTNIPENMFKFVVGIMLVTFGTFWSGEGFGVTWPLSDLFLLVLVAFYLLLSLILIRWINRRTLNPKIKERNPQDYPIQIRILWEVFNFFCGDWTVFWGIIITVAAILFISSVSTLPSTPLILGILLVTGITASVWAAMGRRTQSIHTDM